MNLSPSEIQELRRIRSAGSLRAAKMTQAEVAAQVTASGCEWRLNPRWNGKLHPAGDRVVPRIQLRPVEPPVA